MLLPLLLLGLAPVQDPAASGLCTAPSPCPAPAPDLSSADPQGREGARGIEWFRGSWTEALAKARKEGRLLFVEVSRDGCGYCRKLEGTTFRDASVARELRTLVCFELNASRPAHAPIAREYAPTIYPTMLFLESDGRVRDRVLGYVEADRLVEEARRIKRNERTLSGLEKAILEDPSDVEARYELALKLRHFGDEEGYRDQIAAIAHHDPERTSLPSRRIALEELRQRAQSTLDPTELYAFLKTEGEQDLLFEGWYAIWQLEGYLERVAKKARQRREHREQKFLAAKTLWRNVPSEDAHFVSLGTSIARSFYEGRKYLERADLEWALTVAEATLERAPRDVAARDTLACTLFALGRRDDAVEHVKICIDREPRNPTWRERLRSFRAND